MHRSQGFGLIDFMIILSVSTILLAVAVPSAGNIRDGIAVDRIVEMSDQMARACHRFQLDTGRGAIELSISADGESYAHPRHHELAMPQPIPGWQGPYIEAPLRQVESPVDGPVYLVNDLGTAPASGFVLEPGAPLLTGSGQALIFHGVPRRIAEKVDARIDGSDGQGGWNSSGRVEWIPQGRGSLSIFLMQFPQSKGDVR